MAIPPTAHRTALYILASSDPICYLSVDVATHHSRSYVLFSSKATTAHFYWPFIEISLPGVRRLQGLLHLDLLLFAPIEIRHRAVLNALLIAGLQQVVEEYPAYGFGKLFMILRRWGHRWNHKRVHRIYCRLNLNKRRRGKKRFPNRYPIQLAVPDTMNG